MTTQSDISALFWLGHDDARDQRRSSRINAQFWVQVMGIDDAPCLRTGNLSVTGLFVHLRRAVGKPGDALLLHVTSRDRSKTVKSLARVSRVLRQEDLHGATSVIGAAFEFLPYGQLKSELVDLLHHVTTHELRTTGNIRLDRSLGATVDPANGDPFNAVIRSVGPEQVLLSSPVPLPRHEELRIDVPYGADGLVGLRGRVARCATEARSDELSRYGITVRLEDELARDADESVGVETLMRNMVVPSMVPPRLEANFDLAGQLSRLKASSVLSLLELERLTGVLAVSKDTRKAIVYVREGRILDAELDTAELDAALEPRDVIQDLIGWDEGSFEFISQNVDRPARLHTSTTGLLLDILQEQGEPEHARARYD